MNTFKVSLSGFGASHVEADRYEEAGDVIRFYRRDSLISEYPKCMVKEVVPLGGIRSDKDALQPESVPPP